MSVMDGSCSFSAFPLYAECAMQSANSLKTDSSFHLQNISKFAILYFITGPECMVRSVAKELMCRPLRCPKQERSLMGEFFLIALRFTY